MSSRQNILTTEDKINKIYLGQSEMQCNTFEYSENDQTSRYRDRESALKSQRAIKANILENTPKHGDAHLKYPPQGPTGAKNNSEERFRLDKELVATPNLDFNLSLSSPLNTTNLKGFRTDKTKVNLNLMEEGRDSSIYDTITTYTGMMTSAKKDESKLNNS